MGATLNRCTRFSTSDTSDTNTDSGTTPAPLVDSLTHDLGRVRLSAPLPKQSPYAANDSMYMYTKVVINTNKPLGIKITTQKSTKASKGVQLVLMDIITEAQRETFQARR
jgi:hypothetical protein